MRLQPARFPTVYFPISSTPLTDRSSFSGSFCYSPRSGESDGREPICERQRRRRQQQQPPRTLLVPRILVASPLFLLLPRLPVYATQSEGNALFIRQLVANAVVRARTLKTTHRVRAVLPHAKNCRQPNRNLVQPPPTSTASLPPARARLVHARELNLSSFDRGTLAFFPSRPAPCCRRRIESNNRRVAKMSGKDRRGREKEKKERERKSEREPAEIIVHQRSLAHGAVPWESALIRSLLHSN